VVLPECIRRRAAAPAGMLYHVHTQTTEHVSAVADGPARRNSYKYYIYHICDQPTRACCLFRAQGQPMVTGVLLLVDQSRGTVYLWHCDQVTSRRRLSEDI